LQEQVAVRGGRGGRGGGGRGGGGRGGGGRGGGGRGGGQGVQVELPIIKQLEAY
jgi:hypothetical protein